MIDKKSTQENIMHHKWWASSSVKYEKIVLELILMFIMHAMLQYFQNKNFMFQLNAFVEDSP